MKSTKIEKRIHRKRRIKATLKGSGKIRLSVYRSTKYIYAQLIDDKKNTTVLSVSEKLLGDTAKGTKSERAFKLGELVAVKALEKKIDTVVFDRNGYLYHGRVKSLADGARKGGLKF
jgi:large subunit ribosomal protein L18